MKRKQPPPQTGFDFDAIQTRLIKISETPALEGKPETPTAASSGERSASGAGASNSRRAEAPKSAPALTVSISRQGQGVIVPPLHLPTLQELLRASVGAPLKSRAWRKGDPGDPEGHVTKFDTFWEPKIGTPAPEPVQITTIEGIGAETRALYIKLAVKDGDWRAWHRLWPNVKPNKQMIDLFVIGRAKFLEAQRNAS